MKFSLSLKILFGLVLLYAVLAAVSVFLPQPQGPLSGGNFPASKFVLALANAGIILVVYGGLGFAGNKLSRETGFPDLWSPEVSLKQRLVIPMITGIVLGIVLICGDLIFSNINSIGRLQHPPFPLSLIASFTAGTGEEIIFRLFFISFWIWLISNVMLKGRGRNTVFLVVSVFSALLFAMTHLPAIMFLYGWMSPAEIPSMLIAEIIIMNCIVSVFAILFFRKYGILAAIGLHFWADIVWHFIWPLF